MGIITKMRKQTAVYWALSSIDEYGAEVYLSPVEIACRWEDVSEQFLDAEGNTVMSNAQVYVDRDMILGSVLMLGELTDITDAVNIKENAGAWEVRRYDNLPNLKATEFLKTAML
jgi:hypothetical protein